MEKEKILAWLDKLIEAKKLIAENTDFYGEKYHLICNEADASKVQLFRSVPQVCDICGFEMLVKSVSGEEPYTERSFFYKDMKFFDYAEVIVNV